MPKRRSRRGRACGGPAAGGASTGRSRTARAKPRKAEYSRWVWVLTRPGSRAHTRETRGPAPPACSPAAARRRGRPRRSRRRLHDARRRPRSGGPLTGSTQSAWRSASCSDSRQCRRRPRAHAPLVRTARRRRSTPHPRATRARCRWPPSRWRHRERHGHPSPDGLLDRVLLFRLLEEHVDDHPQVVVGRDGAQHARR